MVAVKRRFIPRLPDADALTNELREWLKAIRDEIAALRADLAKQRENEHDDR